MARRAAATPASAARARRAAVLLRLQAWVAVHATWYPQYQALQALTGSQLEAPLPHALLALWEAYTQATAREVGDTAGWLDWYCYDNDMGSRGMRAGTTGTTRRIKTVADLAWLICSSA